ncbi:T9SS type A sorting domain-containing protein [Flavobacteriaceae bacterium]|nr:T9SS type A sorting domain-containing protein [Flavobacteriaceae bacterium]
MKSLSTILILLITSICFSQIAPIDFEAGGEGANWGWNVFENADNPPLEFVANPDPSGINTSAMVAKFTARDTNAGAAPFAGLESQHGGNIGTFDLTIENALVNIMVYKTKISDVGIKFATPSGGAQTEIKVANTLINQWELITVDFTSYIGLGETTGLDQIIVFPDFINRTADDIIYFDNITFGETVPNTIALPITLEGGQAPAFSDFNGSSTLVIDNPDSSGANTSATVAQNTVPANAAFAGVNYPVNNIDITTDKVFSLSVWSPLPNIPVLLKLENASGVNTERAAVTTTTNAWETITFDFTDEGQLTYQSVTIFMNFNMTDAADQVYYWDNLVLGEPLGVSENTLANITLYPNPATSVVVLQASQEIATIQVLNLLGQRISSVTVNNTKSTINVSDLSAGTYIANVLFSNGNTQNINFIKK